MTAIELKAGTEFLFTPTGKQFKIEKVTDTRISWYTGFERNGGTGANTLKMVWVTKREFQKGIDNGSYILQ